MRLDEEREDEHVMDPETAGALRPQGLRNVLLDVAARRAIEASRQPTSTRPVPLFEGVVEGELKALPEAEAALERTRLLGSPVASGLGEVVFRMEAERPAQVIERLLETSCAASSNSRARAAAGGSR